MFLRLLIVFISLLLPISTFPKSMKSKNVGGVELVYIKAGSFVRGASSKRQDYSPARKVKISRGFWIGKYEITQRLYQRITGKNPVGKSRYGRGASLPVYNISWYDAVEFCNMLSKRNGLKPAYFISKVDLDRKNLFPFDRFKWTVRLIPGANGFRLPTEAQWEYAARASGRSRFYWGTGSSWKTSGKYAWHLFNTGKRRYKGKRFWWVKYHKVKPVGKKRANRWGLHDISGNVSEWCWDRYSKSYYRFGRRTDPAGPVGDFNYGVLRGGSFLDSPADLAVYRRWPMSRCERRATNGLRVVLPK